LQGLKERAGQLGVMNNFKEDLEFAETGKNDPFWKEVFKKAFPNMTECMRNTKGKCKSQQDGVDWIIYLENHKTITADAKLRREQWKDIALEYISNDRKNTPGWMEKDLCIDYLAYGFFNVKTVYLFDWRMLKRAWDHYKEIWKKQYQNIKALNEGYRTHSVCVPIDVLITKASLASIIKLDQEKEIKINSGSTNEEERKQIKYVQPELNF
jgi:hypothetical protein